MDAGASVPFTETYDATLEGLVRSMGFNAALSCFDRTDYPTDGIVYRLRDSRDFEEKVILLNILVVLLL